MRIAGLTVRALAALAAAVLVAGCDTGTPSREETIDALADDLLVETDHALSQEQATCVATELVDAGGTEGLDELLTQARSRAPDSEARLTVIDAFATCDALEPLLSGTTTTTSAPATSSTEPP